MMTSLNAPTASTSANPGLHHLGQALSSVTPANEPLANFHKFPELPLELRDKIWGFAVLPRFVQAYVRTFGNSANKRVVNKNLGLAIAQTSRESRRVYLAIKKTVFDAYFHPCIIGRPLGTRRMNLDEDTLYITRFPEPSRSMPEHVKLAAEWTVSSEVIENVKRLAVDLTYLNVTTEINRLSVRMDKPGRLRYWSQLKAFGKLEDFVVILTDSAVKGDELKEAYYEEMRPPSFSPKLLLVKLLEQSLEFLQNDGHLKGLKLKFMVTKY